MVSQALVTTNIPDAQLRTILKKKCYTMLTDGRLKMHEILEVRSVSYGSTVLRLQVIGQKRIRVTTLKP